MCAGGACVNVMNNALNCGTCGTQCPAGSVCNGGACGCSASGQMLCGNACVDVMSDSAHCGACNRPCSGACTNGQCTVTPGTMTLLPPSIRRMTNAEYDASVQALLGTTMTPSTTFPPDSRQLGGYTLNDAQRVDPVMTKALDDAAQALVAEARTAGKFATLAPCTNTTSGGEACAKTFITSFGAKAFRRPVTTLETTDLVALYHAGADSPGTYNEGIDLLTRGMLQSAGFLYVTAIGPAGSSGTFALTKEELASNLSYLVAGGPPNQTLLDMANAGGLGTADGREAQVRRLFGTPAGKDRMVRVVREWLGVDRIPETAKDTTVYTRFTTAVRTAMDTETKKFIDEVVQRSTGTVGELLSANWSIVDSTLAPIYGVTSAGASAHTMLPKRLGILNQAAFLSVFAHAQESAPVLRGVAVMRRVACINMPDPQSVNIQVVPPDPRPGEVDARSFRHPRDGRGLRQLPQLHRSDRLRVRDVRRDGRAARRGHDIRNVQGRAPGRERPADQRQHHEQHHHRRQQRFPERLRGELRRQQRPRDGARQQRAGARVPGAAILPLVLGPNRHRGRFGRHRHESRAVVRRRLEAAARRSAGQVHRGAGRLCAQPAVRSTERPVKNLRRATRRSFLKAVGAGATALPFYRLLENSVMAQAGAPLPLRFCGIYHPHGISMEYFAMLNGRFSGLGNDTETTFNLTYTNSGTQCVLQPFDDAATYGQSFKSKILPIEGIDLMSNANGHDTAGTILTGSYVESGKPKNSSLDQYMAVERKLGMSTRVTSISVGVGDDTTQVGQTLSYGPGGAALPKIIDPVQAFNTLFSGYAPTTDPTAAAAAMRNRAKGRSVIDFVNKDVTRLRGKLAGAEQQKLDQHLDSLRDFEKQFAEPTTGGSTGGTCTVPAKPDSKQWMTDKLKRYNGGEPYFDVITNGFIDLLTQAFACDITRFATFLMADLSYSGNPLGLNADNHGAVAHTYNGSQLETTATRSATAMRRAGCRWRSSTATRTARSRCSCRSWRRRACSTTC